LLLYSDPVGTDSTISGVKELALNETALSRRGRSSVLIFAILAAATLASGSRGEAGGIFDHQGRLVTKGRIFSAVCRDFNGDGRPDIVVSDYLNPARILYNDAGLAFMRVMPLITTSTTGKESGHGVALADFNGDGRLDLFLVYNESPSRVLFGDGKGGFVASAHTIGGRGLNGTSIKAADVDGDGDIDVFITYYKERARLYINDGAGNFTESDQRFFDGIAVGDLDGDGDIDVVSGREDGRATVWLNEKGRFGLQDQTVDVGNSDAQISLVDVDADGDFDLIALGRTTPSTLWLNDGGGAFRKSEQAFNPGTRLAVGDLDLDGNKDLVIGSSVWLNKGGGRFENVQTLSLGLTSCLELADIDGDGDLDLLGAGLDRATGQADLLLFLNGARRR
jgi:hypothetical protein